MEGDIIVNNDLKRSIILDNYQFPSNRKIPNDDSYIKNLEKYARINKTIPQDKEETIIRDDRLHKIIKVPAAVQNSDASIVQATLDSLVHTSDSSAIQNKPDTLEKHNTADTLSLGITIPDSLIHNQEAR